MPVGLSTNAANPIKSNRLAFLSRIGREEFYNGLFIFGIPQITDMSAVWIERHLVAQRLFERFDGFSLGQEIIDVVQNVHFGIATQPIHDGCERASLEKAFRVRLGIS